MSALTFDTYKAVQSLIDRGVDRNQAEGFTKVIQQAQESNLLLLATKEDIGKVRTELVRLEGKIDGEMKLLHWILAANSAGIFALLLKSFFNIG